MLSFFPKFSSVEAACEFIFVVDCSGSHTLKVHQKHWFYFSRVFQKVATSTSLALVLGMKPSFHLVCHNQETMERATNFAKANFGGTEPLKFIFKSPHGLQVSLDRCSF